MFIGSYFYKETIPLTIFGEIQTISMVVMATIPFTVVVTIILLTAITVALARTEKVAMIS